MSGPSILAIRAGQRRCSTPSYLRTLTRIDPALFSSTLCPVSQKLRLSLVRQRMIEELIDHLERHRGDVCAHACGLDHVNRVAQTRGEHLSVPTVVLINLNDVLQQDQTVFADVVETSEERTDKRCTRLRRKDRLRCRETKRDVYFDSFVRQLTCGFEAVARQRTLN